MPRIRQANRTDAARLSELARTTFTETFAAANTDEDMALHCQASYGEAIQAREIADPAMLTLLSEEGASLVGYAQLRWGPAPGCVAAHAPAELQRLYVASAWHGKGIAHELMQACLWEMAARGSDVTWLGVWERNPRAAVFYRKFGFVAVGDHVFAVGDDPQRDVIMARPVADGATPAAAGAGAA